MTSTTQAGQTQPHKGPSDVEIIVNGRPRAVSRNVELTFDQVVALAFDEVPTGPNVFLTVTYRRGQGNKPEGVLAQGETLKVKDGMIISVTATDKS